MTHPTCETCRFYGGGECRIHAPSLPHQPPSGMGGGFTLRVWPRVWAMDWCGEHQPIPAEEQADADPRS